MSRRPLVIGIGNEHRADDAAGLAVARTLRARALRGVAVAEASGEMMALMEAWRHAETVILVDAVTSGAPPGTLHRLDVQAESIPDAYFPCSTHAFGVAEAIALARALDQLPPRLIVYGIEGQSFRATVGLSPPVAKGVALAAEHIVHELRNVRPAGRRPQPRGRRDERRVPERRVPQRPARAPRARGARVAGHRYGEGGDGVAASAEMARCGMWDRCVAVRPREADGRGGGCFLDGESA